MIEQSNSFGKDIDPVEAAIYMRCLVVGLNHWIVLCSKQVEGSIDFAVNIAERYFTYDVEHEDHGFLFHPTLGEIHWFRKSILSTEHLKTSLRHAGLTEAAKIVDAGHDILVPCRSNTLVPVIIMINAFKAAVMEAAKIVEKDHKIIDRLVAKGFLRRLHD